MAEEGRERFMSPPKSKKRPQGRRYQMEGACGLRRPFLQGGRRALASVFRALLTS